jgi:hypothetical protein
MDEFELARLIRMRPTGSGISIVAMKGGFMSGTRKARAMQGSIFTLPSRWITKGWEILARAGAE